MTDDDEGREREDQGCISNDGRTSSSSLSLCTSSIVEEGGKNEHMGQNAVHSELSSAISIVAFALARYTVPPSPMLTTVIILQ